MTQKPNKIQFIIGIILVLLGAILIFFNLELITSIIAIEILGIGLIATSNYKLI